MNKKKIVIFIVSIVIILIVGGIIFMSNTKNKVNEIIDVGKLIMEGNERLNSSKNIYTKEHWENIEWGDSEFYKLGDISKDISYDPLTGIKCTDIYSPTKIIHYKESNDGKIKIMCEGVPEDDEQYEMENEETEFYEDEENSSGFEMISSGTIDAAMNTRITESIENGRECYIYEYDTSRDDSGIAYVDKETGFIFKYIMTQFSPKTGEKVRVTQYTEHSFGTVTEKDVAELDKKDFKLLSEEEFDNYKF